MEELKKENEQVGKLGVILPYNLLKDVKAFAVRQDTTISDIVRGLLEKVVYEPGNTQNKEFGK